MPRPERSLTVRRILTYVILTLIIFSCIVVSVPGVKAVFVRLLSRRRSQAAAAAARRRRRRAAEAQAERLDQLRGDFAADKVDDGLPVPNVVHFVFGLEQSFGHIKFGLLHYLAILGAAVTIKPDEIRWHYNYLPEGMWWECARPHLTLHKVEDVTHVHGKPKPMRVQHKADILRMQIMLNEGGMYIVRARAGGGQLNPGDTALRPPLLPNFSAPPPIRSLRSLWARFASLAARPAGL
jgi:hypothetical protein